MTATAGIEIATGGNAQSLYQATTQSTGLTATAVSQKATATSFRSSWQSLLASLGTGLDGASGNETGAGVAQASTGPAQSATKGTTSQAGLSQSALTPSTASTAKTQETGTLTAAAASSQAIAQSGASVLKSTPVIEGQTASQLTEKSTAKAHAAESTTDTHSTKNAKHETDSTGATKQVLAVPDSASQFSTLSVQQAAIATPSVAVAAPVAGTANLQASVGTPAMSMGLADTAKGKTSLISAEISAAGSQTTNQVGESALSRQASSVSATEAGNEEPQACLASEVGVATDKGSAAQGALSRSTLPDSAPASGVAPSLATSSSSWPASSVVRSAASDQSPAPIVASADSGNQTATISKGEATQAQIPVRAASENQIQSLPSSSNQAQSAGTETLAVTAGGDGLQASAMVADSAKSQSSPSSATSSIGKKAVVASAERTSEQTASRLTQHDPMQQSGSSTAGQSSLAAQDGAGLVRDTSVGHGSIGITGNTAGELAAATTSRDESASRDTFSALDSGSPTTPTWIHANSQRAEAGFQDPTLGWVGVRADSSGGSVHASLVAGSADAAQTLSGHLAGLNAYLADQHTAIGSVTVAASEDRSASYNSTDQSMNQNMNQGAGQDGSRGQQSVPAVSVPTFTSTVSSVSAARTEASTPGGSLGGTHISLIA